MSGQSEVAAGQFLIQRQAPLVRDGKQVLPERFTLWHVKSARKLKNGDMKATLSSGGESFSCNATATFYGGTLGETANEGWRLVKLGTADLRLLYEGQA